MAELRLAFLGLPQVFYRNEPVHFRTRKVLALLAYLALEEGMHSREKLASFFWPDSPPEQARLMLRTTLNHLRRGLGETEVSGREDPRPESRLLTDHGAVGFDLAGSVELDVQTLQTAFNAIQRLSSADTNALAQLELAAGVYRGEFLEGFSLGDASEFDDWVGLRRESYRLWMDAVFERLTDMYDEGKKIAPAIEMAGRWVAQSPLNETAYERLIELHFDAGNRAAALQIYRSCELILAQQLGVEPNPAIQALAGKIQAASAAQTRPSSRPRQPDFSGGDIPFIGRAAEHTKLVAVYQTVRQNHLPIVIIQGEPGIGKSRLVSEFLNWAAAQGADVVIGQAYETGCLSYHLWVDALRQRLELENAPEDLLSDLWLAELSRVLPELRERYPDLPPPTSDQASARSRFFEAVTRLGLALAARAPLVIALDDAHWADEDSMELLSYVARRWSGASEPILLILTVRAEIEPRWLAELERSAQVTQLPLSPLTAVDTQNLLHQLTPEQNSEQRVEAFGNWLFAQTRGQPLFIVETLKALLESETLTSRSQEDSKVQFDLARETQEVKKLEALLPPGVQKLIRARTSALSPSASALLAAGAVLGHGFSLEKLCQVANLDENDGLTSIDELLRTHLLREAVHSGRTVISVYFFTHDKIREVVYSEMTQARKLALHKRAYQMACANGAISSEIAYHALAGGQTDAAFEYSLKAARESAQFFAVRDAIARYEQALTLLRANDPATQFQRVMVKNELGNSHMLLSAYAEAAQAFEESLALAAQIDDQPGVASALCGLGQIKAAQGNYDEALSLLERSVTIADSLALLNIVADGLTRLGRIYHNRGNYERAVATLNHALEASREAGDQRRIASALAGLGHADYAKGNYAEAIHHLEEGLAISRQIGHWHNVAKILSLLGDVVGYDGRYVEAKDYFTQALALLYQIDDKNEVAATLLGLGLLAYWQGAYEEASQHWTTSLEIYREIGNRAGNANMLSNLGVLAKAQKQYAKAAKYTEESLVIFRELGYQFGIAAALNNLGEIAFLEERYPESESYFNESSAIFVQMGRPVEAVTAITNLGRANLKLNENDAAAANFHQALEIASAIGVIPRQLDALLGISQLRAATGRPEEALALLGLVLNHPASDSEVKTHAELLLDELRTTLAEGIIAAGLEYGKTLDLAAVIDHALNEQPLFS